MLTKGAIETEQKTNEKNTFEDNHADADPASRSGSDRRDFPRAGAEFPG